MATRLYLNTVAPANSPAFDSSWEVTGSAVRRILETQQGDASQALESLAAATTSNTPAGAVDVLIAQYVSAPLASGVTISGAIRGQARFQESSATGDLRVQTVIRVLQSDYSTVRGTLIASNAGALSHEFNTSLRNISIPLGGSTVPTSVAAQAGDVIVVELGYRKHESATTSRTGTLSAGNPIGTDLPVDETTATAGVPWIEFTEALSFAAVSSRVSDVVVQPAITPPSVNTRTSAVVVQPAITPPTVETRASLVVVQVAVLLSGAVVGSSARPRAYGYILGG